MNRKQYLEARRLIRDNGRCAYAWIADMFGWPAADALRDLNDGQDWMAERQSVCQYCQREGRSFIGWLGADLRMRGAA